MTKQFLFSGLIALSLFSCVQTEPDPIYHPLSAESKAFFDFKPGSYWVYQDSLSGQFDKTFVNDYKTEYSDCTPFRCGIYFKKQAQHFCENISYSQILSGKKLRILLDTWGREWEIIHFNSDDSTFRYQQHDFYFDGKSDTICGRGELLLYWEAKKNVGLIKYMLPDSSIHTLVEYKAVQ
ncbi:MAG: hypothetical protein ACKOXB_13060 [Flavobacteriales bacterium]